MLETNPIYPITAMENDRLFFREASLTGFRPFIGQFFLWRPPSVPSRLYVPPIHINPECQLPALHKRCSTVPVQRPIPVEPPSSGP